MEEEFNLETAIPAENQEFYGGTPPEEEETHELIIDDSQPAQQPQPTSPQEQGQFPAAFGSKIGFSTVDLSIPENAEAMKAEHDEWWNLGKKRGFLGIPYTGSEYQQERNALKDKWY